MAGKGSAWYGRIGLDLKSHGKWIKKRFIKANKKSSNYGLGGVSFTSSSRGAWVKAKPNGRHLGSQVDELKIHYLAQPKGGTFKVEFANQTHEVNTLASESQIKVFKLKATQSGAWESKATILGGGKVTLFGFEFERKQKGVIYDSLGIEGARARLLLRLMTPAWVQQIRQRNPDLFVLHYGTNESVNEQLNMMQYRDTLREVIRGFKKAVPQASCLLMSPMDRAKKSPTTGRLVSMKIIQDIVLAQREVALEQGCAFWSAFDAMGGKGSMSRWYKASPRLASGDWTHPTRMVQTDSVPCFLQPLWKGIKAINRQVIFILKEMDVADQRGGNT